jgi:hypothetical protein
MSPQNQAMTGDRNQYIKSSPIDLLELMDQQLRRATPAGESIVEGHFRELSST